MRRYKTYTNTFFFMGPVVLFTVLRIHTKILFSYGTRGFLSYAEDQHNLNKHHAIKTYGGSVRIAPRLLNLGTRWRLSSQLHVPAALLPEKEFPVPIG